MSCGHCQFFAELAPGKTECRKNPPVPMRVDGTEGGWEIVSVWPPVLESDGCGSFQNKVYYK